MGTAVEALEPLDVESQHRALAWLSAALGARLSYEPVLDADEMIGAAAEWAAAAIGEMQADEIEQAVLNRQGWGDEVGLIEGALPEIVKRLLTMGGVKPDGD